MTRVNREGEPSYAGIATFSKLQLALTPAELEGADVAIVGAPFDEAVSNRPGTRFGPRAIRNADDSEGVPPTRPHMLLGIDPFEELNVVDYGDAETTPGDTAKSHEAVKALVGEICAAGAIPVILGGDHSVALPDMTAVAEHYGLGTVGVIHFDAHADTGGARGRHAVARLADAARGRPGRDPRRSVHPGGPARLVARGGGVHLDARVGLSLVHDVRARRARLRALPERGNRGRKGLGSRVPVGRHRLARPRVRAGHGHAGDRRPHDP